MTSTLAPVVFSTPGTGRCRAPGCPTELLAIDGWHNGHPAALQLVVVHCDIRPPRRPDRLDERPTVGREDCRYVAYAVDETDDDAHAPKRRLADL